MQSLIGDQCLHLETGLQMALADSDKRTLLNTIMDVALSYALAFTFCLIKYLCMKCLCCYVHSRMMRVSGENNVKLCKNGAECLKMAELLSMIKRDKDAGLSQQKTCTS